MHAVRQLLALLSVIFLLLAVPFSLTAQPPLPDSKKTAVGEPIHVIIAEQERVPAATAAERFTFLPLITGAGEGKDGTRSEVREVVELVNSERAQVGCPPLQISSQLTAAAQGHSEDMAHNDYFSHTSLDGRSPWDRIRAEGYDFWSAAENIAAGYPTPAAVVAAWIENDGHRANILSCDLEDIGVGYYYLANDTGDLNYHHYWTQNFGRRR
ncbi:MAG: CAP domain-containing protein [Anaerolineaceae bacterium]|nr:MAG: CAP domain-containing protein [Anaerolineaceae bacterium]